MDACTHGAREFNDDTEKFFADLKKGERISILIAPAFLANYPKEYESVLGGLKALGVNRMIILNVMHRNFFRNYSRYTVR